MMQRESRYVKVARIAYTISQTVLSVYSHLNSPHWFTLPQLAACVLLMFYVRKSYRDMEEWLLASDRICQVLGLASVPDHTTLYRAYKRFRMGSLAQLQRTLLIRLDLQEEMITFDTTGYRPTQASEQYLARSGVRYRHFVKGGYAVGTRSQLILGWKSGLGPSADTPFLEPLRRQARPYGQRAGRRATWLALADAGFDGQRVRADDLIPPIRRGGDLRSPARKARRDRVDAARLAGVFGQRWKSETVNSVIKRKFGDEIRSKKLSHRKREPIVKGLIYNIHRLSLCFT